DGSLDTTFSGDGKQTIHFGAGDDRAFGVAIDNFGRIVLAGYTQVSGNNFDMAVARLTPSGNLDTSFSFAGKPTIAFNRFGPQDDEATDVAIDSSGRIVLGGFAQFSGNDYDFAVARLNASGTLDTSFSGTGKRMIAFDIINGGHDDRANAVTIDRQ